MIVLKDAFDLIPSKWLISEEWPEHSTWRCARWGGKRDGERSTLCLEDQKMKYITTCDYTHSNCSHREQLKHIEKKALPVEFQKSVGHIW